jgi:hypothetical protein
VLQPERSILSVRRSNDCISPWAQPRGLVPRYREQGAEQVVQLCLLAPIYGWFIEGFDTPDLKEAKACWTRWGKRLAPI